MKKAFTLVEIMIVVAIIALLAAIAVPGILRSRVNAATASVKINLKATASALENYVSSEGSYPNSIADLVSYDPPYLEVNFFDGQPHEGYNYVVGTLTRDQYSLNATPVVCNATGKYNVVISSGMHVVETEC